METPVSAFFPTQFKQNSCACCSHSYISIHVPIADSGPIQSYMALGCPKCGRNVFFDARIESRYYEDTQFELLPLEIKAAYQKAGLWERARLIQELWLDSLEACGCGAPYKMVVPATRCPKCNGSAAETSPHQGMVSFMDRSAGIGPNDDTYPFAVYITTTENGRQMAEQLNRSGISGSAG